MKTLKSRQEVATELGISTRTLSRIIQRLKLKIPPRRLLTPADQKKIHDALS